MSRDSVIWVAEDDRSLRWVMEKALIKGDMQVRTFESGDQLLGTLEISKPDVIISDIRMPGTDGLRLLAKIHSKNPGIPVIITTAHSDLDLSLIHI